MSDGIESTVVDCVVRDRAAQWLGRAGVRLPTFAELAGPARIPTARKAALRAIDSDRPSPANLFRVHWYNDPSRSSFAATPSHPVCRLLLEKKKKPGRRFDITPVRGNANFG